MDWYLIYTIIIIMCERLKIHKFDWKYIPLESGKLNNKNYLLKLTYISPYLTNSIAALVIYETERYQLRTH